MPHEVQLKSHRYRLFTYTPHEFSVRRGIRKLWEAEPGDLSAAALRAKQLRLAAFAEFGTTSLNRLSVRFIRKLLCGFRELPVHWTQGNIIELELSVKRRAADAQHFAREHFVSARLFENAKDRHAFQVHKCGGGKGG